eukprot:1009437-Pelagomonas_calceolata.AAC.1
MDIILAGEDQSQADQPNSLAEGTFLPQLSCPSRQILPGYETQTGPSIDVARCHVVLGMGECMGVLKGRPYPVPCLGEITEGT